MDDRTRMAKCFVIVTENCKRMIVEFVEDRVCRPGFSLKQYIQSKPAIENDSMVREVLPNMNSSDDLDISALWSVVRIGNLLTPIERKSPGYAQNTVGDLIERIRHLRNDIAHTGKASLDENDYSDKLADFKDIAKKFEVINNKSFGAYTTPIEEIDKTPWADEVVEQKIVRYTEYVQTIVRLEVMPVYQTNKTDVMQSVVTGASTAVAATGFLVGGPVGAAAGVAAGAAAGTAIGLILGKFRK